MLYYLSQYILNATQGTEWQGPLSGLRVFHYIVDALLHNAIETDLCFLREQVVERRYLRRKVNPGSGGNSFNHIFNGRA